MNACINAFYVGSYFILIRYQEVHPYGMHQNWRHDRRPARVLPTANLHPTPDAPRLIYNPISGIPDSSGYHLQKLLK